MNRSARVNVSGATGVLLLAVIGNGARADLRFAQPAADAGEVRTGMPLAQRFAFVNTGPDAVIITEVRADCGCLTPRLDKHTYQPGERGSLLLEVNTLTQAAGPQTWHVHVSCRSGETAGQAALQLSARMVAEVTVQPAALTVYTDQSVRAELLLTDRRAKPLSVTGVQASSPALKAQLAGVSSDVVGLSARRIRLEVVDDFPEGRHQVVVAIYTDDPDYRELKVPVGVVKQARHRLAVSPGRVDLLAPAGQAVPSRVVLVRSADNQRVVIAGLTADDPAIKCRWAPGPGAMATVKITVDRALMPGESLHSAVHIKVAGPVAETLSVPVSCTAK